MKKTIFLAWVLKSFDFDWLQLPLKIHHFGAKYNTADFLSVTFDR